MTREEKVILAVSILEGRNFRLQNDARCQLIVEVKFCNETLETDPVPCVESPKFDAELAFELDRRSLHHHRLHRTAIKLRCFNVNTRTGKRDDAGYAVLSLRDAKEEESKPKWTGILNVKFAKFRPELYLRVFIDRPGREVQTAISLQEDDSSQERTTQPPDKVPLFQPVEKPTDMRKLNLEPKLNPQEGFYQIGPDSHDAQKYVLSVMLVFAENLGQFFKPSRSNKYYLWYSLLGNGVETQEFENLQNPKFPLERASVKLHCTPDILGKFFQGNSVLRIVLYRKERSDSETPLASAEVSLLELFHNDICDFSTPSKIEDIYEFFPYLDSELAATMPESSAKSIVGVSVCLQKDLDSSLMISRDEAISASISTTSKDMSHNGKKAVANKPSSLDFKDTRYDIATDNMEFLDTEPVREGPTECKKESSVFDRSERSKIDQEKLYHFSFTVDFRSLQLEPGTPLFKCFLRYSYPFFGSSEHQTTLPPIEVNDKDSVIFPNGVSTFQFSSSFWRLEATFRQIPFIIELVESTNVNGRTVECLVGIAKLMLHPIIEAIPTTIIYNTSKLGSRQEITQTISVIALGGHDLGHIEASMVLDELGLAEPASEPCPAWSASKEPSLRNTSPEFKDVLKPNEVSQLFTGEPSLQNSSPEFKNVLKTNNIHRAITGNDVLQVAMELELWKEQQEALFRRSLKEKEVAHLQALTLDFKNRDVERESILKKRLTESIESEEKLKRALSDVDLRERKMRERELELEFKIKDFNHRVKKIEGDAKDAVKRVKLEYEHRLEIEKQRVAELEKDKRNLQKQLSQSEKSLEENSNFIRRLQNKLNQAPETKLESDMLLLKMENETLKKRVEETLAAKNRYKDQWGKALRHNIQLQKQMDVAEKNRLNSQIEALKSLKIEEKVDLDEAILEIDRDMLSKLKSDSALIKKRVQEKQAQLYREIPKPDFSSA